MPPNATLCASERRRQLASKGRCITSVGVFFEPGSYSDLLAGRAKDTSDIPKSISVRNANHNHAIPKRSSSHSSSSRCSGRALAARGRASTEGLLDPTESTTDSVKTGAEAMIAESVETQAEGSSEYSDASTSDAPTIVEPHASTTNTPENVLSEFHVYERPFKVRGKSAQQWAMRGLGDVGTLFNRYGNDNEAPLRPRRQTSSTSDNIHSFLNYQRD